MTQQLFFNKKEGSYYYCVSEDDFDIYCSKCKNIIQLGKYIFIHKSYNKKEYSKEYYCQECVRKKHRNRIVDEFIIAKITKAIPDYSVMISDRPISLSNSTTATVFSIAVSNEGIKADVSNIRIIDHTKLAGRESLDGLSIGVIPEERTMLKSEKQVNKFLLGFQNGNS